MDYIKTDGGRELAGYKTTKDYSGDCVIRSISIALNQAYSATFQEMMELGVEMGGYPSMRPVWTEYLNRKGWVKKKCPRDAKGKLIKLKNWLFNGTAVVLNSGHLTCVKDGAVHDSWDCRYRPVNTYFVEE